MVQVVTLETNEEEYSNGLLKYTCEENGFPFIDANEDKEKFVCWKNRNTSPLYDVIDLCIQRNKILVIICPLFKAYSRDLMYMITNKTKNVRIYETSKMANGSAMRARAGEYQKNFDDAILIPEDLYIGVDSAPNKTGTLENFFA